MSPSPVVFECLQCIGDNGDEAEEKHNGVKKTMPDSQLVFWQ